MELVLPSRSPRNRSCALIRDGAESPVSVDFSRTACLSVGTRRRPLSESLPRQGVKWIVMTDITMLSLAQLVTFRRAMGEHDMVGGVHKRRGLDKPKTSRGKGSGGEGM